MKLLIPLLFLSFLSPLLASMTILKPQGLQDWWDRNAQQTHISVAAFGHIPWGKKVIGHLELAEPRDACSYIRSSDEDAVSQPILVATRGNCPFYLKAHYAQLAGAQLLVIVDNQYEDVDSKLMVDSGGQGESINIPSILLGKAAGDKLIDSLNSDDNTISNVYVVIDFSLLKSDKVNYHLWLTSSSVQTFRFLKSWGEYADKLSHVATMEPHFAHFKVFDGINNAEQNCVCGGKYCCTDPDADLPNNGRDVVLEDLRQMCIINKYDIEAWWQYITAYDDKCLNGGAMLECSKQAMKSVRLDPDYVIGCVNDSFAGNPDLDSCTANKILDKEEAALNLDGAFLFPSVFINGFMYRGNLVPGKGVFEAVCESFKDLPDACVEHFDNPTGASQNDSPVAAQVAERHWPTVLATVAFLIVFGLFVFCCYRRHLKKEMYRQMVRDVNIAVSQYIAFKDDGKDEDTVHE